MNERSKEVERIVIETQFPMNDGKVDRKEERSLTKEVYDDQ